MQRCQYRQRNCRHCNGLFRPHSAVGNRQNYCSTSACQKARKAQNNRSYTARNPNYHSGPLAVTRTQTWRVENPGYWRRLKKSQNISDLSSAALQAEPHVKPTDDQLVTLHYRLSALQVELLAQQSVFQGFAAHLTGCALQAELSSMLGQWHDKGVALGAARGCFNGPQLPLKKGDMDNDKQKPRNMPGATAACAATIQLD